jgi:hypothetical protein
MVSVHTKRSSHKINYSSTIGVNMISREVIEGKQVQGVDETIVYTLTTTPWGSTPTSLAVTAYDVTYPQRTDVGTTVLTGSASATGDVITLPALHALTAGHQYRIEIKFTCSGNIFEAYLLVDAEN